MELQLQLVTVLCIVFQGSLGKRPNNGIQNSLIPSGTKSRIVGGETANGTIAPYHVSLQTIIGSHFCSGVIINESWILTAGHCVIGWQPANFLISSGTNDLWEPEAYYYPDRVFVHPNYDKPLYHNDIALVRLDSPIEFDSKTEPIELASELFSNGSKVLLTGWGKEDPSADYSRELKMADVTNIEVIRCKQMFNNHKGIGIGHICTLSETGAGICYGDSGAPVVSNGTLIGIVNWGEPCAKGFPDVHASVFYYHDWIDRTMSGCLHC